MSILLHLEEMLVVTALITFILLKSCISSTKWIPSLTTSVCCNSSAKEALCRCCTIAWTKHFRETILSFCTSGKVLKNSLGNLYERLFCNHPFNWTEDFIPSVEWLQRSCKRNEFCIKFFKARLMLLSQWNFIVFSEVICIYVVMIGITSSEIFCFYRRWLVTSLLNSAGLLPVVWGDGE